MTKTRGASPPEPALTQSEQLEAHNGRPRQTHQEPIAVIGMGCRFPGAANVDAYWQLLKQGVSAIREVPADRWDADAYYDPDPEAPGKIYTRHGEFLEQVDRFDAQFFSISPVKPSGSIPSSGCYWKLLGRPWSTRESRPTG